MKTTVYDRVAAMLIALLILIGSGVAVLFSLWLSSIAFRQTQAVPVALVPQVGEGGGFPDAETVDPNVRVPGLEFEQDEPTLEETMNSVVDIVSRNAAVLSDVSLPDDSSLVPGGRRGDGRTKGDGSGLTGRSRHWEVHFEKGLTVDQYAKLLDSFQIELGVIQGGGKIVYVSRLSAAKPDVREGKSVDEKRYYLSTIKGDTQNADLELLAKSGIHPNGRIILKFVPPPLEAELYQLEKTYAGAKEKQIRATYFRLARIDSQHKFFVGHQVYRP